MSGLTLKSLGAMAVLALQAMPAAAETPKFSADVPAKIDQLRKSPYIYFYIRGG